MKTAKIFFLLIALAFGIRSLGQNFRLSQEMQKIFDSAYPDALNTNWVKGDYGIIEKKHMVYRTIFKSQGYIVSLESDSVGSFYAESDIDLYLPDKVKKKAHEIFPKWDDINPEIEKEDEGEYKGDFYCTYQNWIDSVQYTMAVVMDSLGNILFQQSQTPINQIPIRLNKKIEQLFSKNEFKETGAEVVIKFGKKSYEIILHKKGHNEGEERVYFDSQCNFIGKEFYIYKFQSDSFP